MTSEELSEIERCGCSECFKRVVAALREAWAQRDRLLDIRDTILTKWERAEKVIEAARIVANPGFQNVANEMLAMRDALSEYDEDTK
jgi:hypothetical protein